MLERDPQSVRGSDLWGTSHGNLSPRGCGMISWRWVCGEVDCELRVAREELTRRHGGGLSCIVE